MWKDRGVWAVLLLAAGLRCLRLGGDLPYVFHFDEPTVVNCAVWLIQHGTLHPHFFNYPTGFIYLLALVFGAVGGIGVALGRFPDWGGAVAWLGAGTYPRPAEGGILYFYPTIGVPALYWIGRSVSALAGVAAVAVVYSLARRLEMGRWPALLAAFMMAISPLAVENSRYATTDMIATLFSALAFAALLRVGKGRLKDWLLFGVLAGLAAGFKYNAGIIVSLTLIAAIWRRRDGRRQIVRGLAAAAAGAIVAFLITTPYSVLDSKWFFRDLGYEFRRISGPSGALGGGAVPDATAADRAVQVLLQNIGLPGVIALALAASMAIRSRRFDRIGILAWAALVVLPMLGWRMLHPRYLLLAMPPLVLLVSLGTVCAARWVIARRKWSSAVQGTLIALGIAAVLGPGLYNLGMRGARWMQADPRISMTRWIDANIPTGSSIVAEKDGPFPDRDRFAVRVVDLVGRETLSAYRSDGVRYLALSGQEKRIRGSSAEHAVLANLEEIRRSAETIWSSGRYAILRVPVPDWQAAVEAMRNTGDLAGARRMLEARLAEEAGSIHPWKMLADLCRELGDTASARSAYRHALSLDPEDLEVLLGASTLATDAGRWDEAVGLLDSALARTPRDPLVNHNMAVARLYRSRELFGRGEVAAAREEWEAARRAAATSMRFAPGDPQMAEIANQVERMGARWGFTAGP